MIIFSAWYRYVGCSSAHTTDENADLSTPVAERIADVLATS
jgi:hypothetical protein